MKKRKQGVTGNEVKPRWELDYDLLENEGLFGEYLEMGKSRRYGEKRHSDWFTELSSKMESLQTRTFFTLYKSQLKFLVKNPRNCLLNFVPRSMRRTLFCYSVHRLKIIRQHGSNKLIIKIYVNRLELMKLLPTLAQTCP